jgi:hypothetical protein
MANQSTSGRPAKRKKTSRKLGPMAEDDESALDTAMYQDICVGSSWGKILVPVNLDKETGLSQVEEADTLLIYPEPEPEPDHNMNPPPSDNVEHTTQAGQSKGRWFYMKEFVSRVDGILHAMQAREALPSSDACSECSKSTGKWRCRDCMDAKLLCRCCMRRTHVGNPFHRIECWTGSYFRKASLWEVGVYLSLKHQEAPNICPNLHWQHQILEMFQKKKDEMDMQNSPPSSNPVSEPDAYMSYYIPDPDPDPNPMMEEAQNAATISVLDQMLDGKDPNDFMEEDDDLDDDRGADLLDSDAGTGFTTYMANINDGPVPKPVPDAPI